MTLLRCYLVFNVFIQAHKGKAEALCSCFLIVSGRKCSIERASCLMRHLASAAANLILNLKNIVISLLCFLNVGTDYLQATFLLKVSCLDINSEISLCKLIEKIYRCRYFTAEQMAETTAFQYTQVWNYGRWIQNKSPKVVKNKILKIGGGEKIWIQNCNLQNIITLLLEIQWLKYKHKERRPLTSREMTELWWQPGGGFVITWKRQTEYFWPFLPKSFMPIYDVWYFRTNKIY